MEKVIRLLEEMKPFKRNKDYISGYNDAKRLMLVALNERKDLRDKKREEIRIKNKNDIAKYLTKEKTKEFLDLLSDEDKF